MALATRAPSTALTNKAVPELYGNLVIDAAKSIMVCFDCINAVWVSGLVKGSVFYIPKTNVVVATEIVTGTAGSALNPLNTTAVTLTIDQFYEAPIYFDTMTMSQSQLDLAGIAAKESSYAIAKVVDTSVATLFSTLNGSVLIGADGQTLIDDILLSVKQTLDEADVPNEDRFLVIDPSALSDMFKFDKFIANMYGNTGAVASGMVGNSPVYGCQVRVTNNLVAATTGAYAVMMHRGAIAGKIQIDSAYVEEFKREHQILFSVDGLWGVIEAQDTFGVPFYTRKK